MTGVATADQNYVAQPTAETDVIRLAERALDRTGRPQWIHHHPKGHLCNYRCGPLGANVR